MSEFTTIGELRALLDERGVEHHDELNFVKWNDANQHPCFAFETYERPGLLRVHCNLTPEQAVEATLGHSSYTYEQWCSISDAIGDAMEYAHDRAIECPDKADPLWNLDEYVHRVLEVAFEGEATLGRAYEPPVAARWDGDVLILATPRDPSSICVQRSESQPRKVYAEETKVIAATLDGQPPYGELLEALRRDWDIEASWDGLRRFWYIGLTEEGMRKRDEREATLGRGECHPIISDNLNESEGTGDAWADCSACGHLLFVLTDPTSEQPNYCPNCGRHIVEVDE